ncbi:unnamed protein product [Malus baccata var. baccata]
MAETGWGFALEGGAKASRLFLCNGNLNVPCRENERQTLLMFKKDLTDSSNLLSSWVAEGDCCTWTGVACDNLTGHVRELQLAGYYDEVAGEKHGLGGKHLTYLDLSYNNFKGQQIPSSLGSLKGLRYLNLSYAEFNGAVPHQLGNLSSLRYLDLSYNFALKVENLKWLSGISQLKRLGMSELDLTRASHWLQVNTLPSLLVELHLSECNLYHLPSGIANLASLKVLDLSDNNFNPTIPQVNTLPSLLVELHLSDCELYHMPSGIANLTSLKVLDLSSNYFNPTIPQVNTLPSLLVELHLSDCELYHMPSGIANLTSLKILDLSDNYFNSTNTLLSLLVELHLSYCELYHMPSGIANLKSLKVLDLSDNYFNSTNTLPYLLVELHLSYCELYHMPSGIANLTSLKVLDLSLNYFNSTIPQVNTLPSLLVDLNHLESLDLSFNAFHGEILSSLGNLTALVDLDLSLNQLEGEIPNSLGNLVLRISDNSFKGVVSEAHFTNLTSLHTFDANENSLTLKTSPDWVPPFQLSFLSLSSWRLDPPQLPAWLQSQKHLSDVPKYLRVLLLDNNLLTGEIPDCRLHWPNLIVVNLEDNNLIGKIPSSVGDLLSLQSLHLRNNNLTGELPVSLQNCLELFFLDLGGNKFVGSIPIWFGQSLMVLILRSNKFQGTIPDELCSLTELQILDLAHNNLSGMIPRCFQNLSSMATKFSSEGALSIEFRISRHYALSTGKRYVQFPYIENAVVVAKGREVKYNTVLRLVTSLDEIPEELTNLISLQTLNLSDDLLTGRIPSKIGVMGALESLDLSMNKLCGEISPSISNLSFLNHLNLSYNSLVGQIPKSTQLQSFDLSSYAGNKLCGPPLEEHCNTNEAMPPVSDEKHKEGHLLEDGGFYLSLGLGFAFGFWIVLGSLLSNLPWSNAFSQFQNRIVKKLYAAIVEHEFNYDLSTIFSSIYVA